jgi:hypothetical protein
MNNRIILTDYLNEREGFFSPFHGCYVLDPIKLFSVIEWVTFEENVQVINAVYSDLFDEVVVKKKRLVCFWPLQDQFDSDWFELDVMFKEKGVEWELLKKEKDDFEFNNLSQSISRQWKEFVYFLLDALTDDLIMNDQVDEIATLTGRLGSFILFRMNQEGKEMFSFAFTEVLHESTLSEFTGENDSSTDLKLFSTFTEMLKVLLEELDLSSFDTKFNDKHLEKTYYSLVSKDFKTKNIIQNWLDTYSLN